MTAVEPPSTLAPAPELATLAAGTVLHRVHAARFDSTEFNPCRGQPTRFAPIFDADGHCIPSLYAASSFDAAAYETVFHDIDPHAVFKTIPREALESRAHGELALAAPLKLAKLFRPELMRWCLTPAQMVAAPAADYAMTARWAEAIHAASREAQGLIWTSIRCDPDTCVVLFGDRVPAGALSILRRRDPSSSPDLLEDLHAAAARGGIVITV